MLHVAHNVTKKGRRLCGRGGKQATEAWGARRLTCCDRGAHANSLKVRMLARMLPASLKDSQDHWKKNKHGKRRNPERSAFNLGD